MTDTHRFIIDRWQVVKAYQLVKANKGAAGIDNQSISDFEKDLKNNLYKIWNRTGVVWQLLSASCESRRHT